MHANESNPAARTGRVSKVFRGFKMDFAKIGGVKPVLARYAAEPHRRFAQGGDYRIQHLPYRWGLNDQGGRGTDYSQGEFIFDALSQLVRF